jgi:protein transport protein SEC61 subunit gamma-like protein
LNDRQNTDFHVFRACRATALAPVASIDRKRGSGYGRHMEVPYDLTSYIRVLKLASTPSWQEFSQIAKIAGAGIILVGILGFIIFVFMSFVPG